MRRIDPARRNREIHSAGEAVGAWDLLFRWPVAGSIDSGSAKGPGLTSGYYSVRKKDSFMFEDPVRGRARAV
jgi:hypothetical protein